MIDAFGAALARQRTVTAAPERSVDEACAGPAGQLGAVPRPGRGRPDDVGTGAGSRPAPPPLRLHDLTLRHGRRLAVDGLSGAFEPGSQTAVIGPNGAGKSSLLAALAGRLRPAAGRIDGLTPERVAWLPQTGGIDRQFPIRVGEVVALGLWPRLGAFAPVRPSARAAIDAALETVGLAGLQKRPIAELSAGQFQRVLFARLLLQDASVILLDEPYNAVDARTAADLLGLLPRWRREGRTVIVVLHDLEQVRAHFDRSLLLARRPLAWGPTAEVTAPGPLAAARAAAEAWGDEDAAPA